MSAGLRPQFAAADLAGESKPANVVFPQTASASMHLEDKATGAGVDVSLATAQPVTAQTVGGYVVYPAALGVGASVLHRALPSGTEDFVYMSTRPTAAEVDYTVSIGTGIAGLRLVAGVLEFLDETGTPQLHVSPPVIVGADGAPTDGALAVSGCAFDADPSPPWGRAVTAPGATACTIKVTWPDAAVSYPAILDPRWTTTGSMATARIEHTLVLLSTGKALAVGGRSSTSSTTGLASAELYDRTSGTWSATGSLAHGRRLHSATQLNSSSNQTTSGKVLVAGGITGSTSMNTAELYSASSGTWAAAGTMNVARHGHTATLLADGRVLAAGGLNGTTTLTSASLYNPASGSGTWVATTGPIPPPGLKNHTATLIQTTNNQLNNHVLLVGGNNGSTTISAVYLFDPVQNAFSTLASIPSPREQHTAMTLQNTNGKILVAGGKNGSTVLSSAIIFDPSVSNGTWSSAGTMTTPRVGHTMTLLPNTIVANGQVLVAGGSSNGTTVLSSAELFSGTSTWTATPSMPGPLQGHQAVLLSGNMILAAGGLSSSTTVQNAAYLYDASFGLACSSNSQCASGFCANGVCCDTACNGGTCGACNLAGHLGTCTAQPTGTVCRGADGACDVAETCNGSSFACPADAVQPLGSVCRSAVNVCDLPEVCDGTTKNCPADQFAASTTLCRAATTICDAPEFCTGTSSMCPADTVAPATTVCRPPAGGCDVAETCTGTSVTCPADTLAAPGTVCRPAVSLCDVGETCSGTSVACPTDGFAAAGTTCGSGSPAPVCSGSTGTCPVSGTTSDILGFEALADWTFASGATASVVGLNSSRTQGAFSFELAAQGSARLNSAPMSSVGGVNPIFLIDIQLPTNQANPSSYGDVQMLVNSPSLGINDVSLGDVGLTGLSLGTWQTLAFQMPASIASNIVNHFYSDLTFSIVLNVASNETGHYLLDDVRSMPEVVPSLLGVAQDGTTLKAVFDYLTTSSTPVTIPYGTGNGLSNQSGFIASPPETPPRAFVSSTHAPFIATLSGSLLTWTVGSHSVAASSGSPRLTVTANGDGTNDATLPDGRRVNLDSSPPQDPTPAPEPVVGATDTGVLAGALQVTPSGAATYALPIAMAPAVAGVAPNLVLAYNSQGSDAIAGQGWSLQGLSMIHKCPRTKQQDGAARPVRMDADPTTTSGTDGDGICLDGQRLFESGPGTYVPEKKDFTNITYFPSDNHFEVKTKSNETRSYGLTSNARVVGNGLDAQNNTTTATAVWALERVTDAWGNFYYVHYNQDAADFAQTGLRITEIDYTGHMNAGGVVDTPPFASVKLTYESRPDVRWIRFAQSKFPMNQRLKTITTDRGTYTLNYDMDAAGLVSELGSIHYCTGSTCLKDLIFSWVSAPTSWSPAADYSLPSEIPTGKGMVGTQFIDLDGDGRTDLVYASQDSVNSPLVSQAWINTGTTWSSTAQGALPAPLARGGVPTGARFADMDGDGLVDFVVDRANVSCAIQFGCPGVWLNRLAQGHGWEFHPEFSSLPANSTFATLQPIEFNGMTFCDGTNASPANGFCEGFQHMTLQPAALTDINGDGLMDIVRVEEGGAIPNLTAANLEVLVNQGPGSNPAWVRYSEPILTDVQLNFNSEPTATFGDMNRDVFPDLVRESYYGPASPAANQASQLSFFQQFALNVNSAAGVEQFGPTLSRSNCTVTGDGACGGGFRVPFSPLMADVDGDGLYDEVVFQPLYDLTTSSNFASGFGVAMNDGGGPRLSYGGDAGTYAAELSALAPVTNAAEGKAFPQDFAFTLADINGDGLPDLIRNHYTCTDSASCQGGAVNVGGGQVLYNTGTTWGSGNDPWHRSAGANPVPGVVTSPLTAGCGGAFVDLNGDAIPDFIQEEGNNSSSDPNHKCSGSAVGRGAWINAAAPPVIITFPTGRSTAGTTVSYVHITEQGAHTSGVACDGVNANAVYCDDQGLEPGTKPLAIPLRVVSKTSRPDGSGTGTPADTTYAYHSLRLDPNGRGPLGFRRVDVYEHASGMKTETTYAQAYPYTGKPIEVARFQVNQNNAPLTDTQTKYCDTTASQSDGTLDCSPVGRTYPPQTSLFVYPYDVLDVAAIKHDASANQVATESSYRYDDSGNSRQVIVETRSLVPSSGSPTITSSVTVTTTNQYGAAGSQEEKQGKATDVLITATGTAFVGQTSHHTTHAYAAVSTFGGASSTALALAKTEIEPGSGWPLQEDTAYGYDPFGNITATTTCANDFESCAPSANSPSPFSVEHPPFRTTTVSFNTGDFDRPAGPGLIGALSYGSGRFPVKTTTITIHSGGGGTEHAEYTAYDPVKGVLLQKTGDDGLHTCHTYDDLGRVTSEVARCGSTAPVVSTTAYFNPAAGAGTPDNAKLITVTRAASGATTWTFTDDQGKTIESLERGFSGGFIETRSTYNAVGKVATKTKPFLIQQAGDTPTTTYQSVTQYDGFNRVWQVTEDLGAVGASGTTKQLVTTNTYDGLTVTTTRTAQGTPETRTETKNVLGKLQSVIDSLGNEIDYQYDPDGNLVVARTPAQILVFTSYDARGRKTSMTDADLGTWSYVSDGFGDLVDQTDANNQEFAMTYDQLGRMLTKQNLGTSTIAQWIYDTAGGAGIGRLAATIGEPDTNLNGSCALPSGAVVSGGNRSVKAYAYTSFGDVQAAAECADGDTFQTSYEYDALGRQSLIRYPAVNGKQVAVGYHYTGLGYLQYLSDDSSDSSILWQAKAMDAFGNVTDEQTRNGVETVQSRSAANGWLTGSTSTAHADSNTVIQNWTYTFDEVGNLVTRERADQVADAISVESFAYDALNRVTESFVTVGAPANVKASSSYVYDGNGNLTEKDGKTYTYGVCPGPGRAGSGLHQVCSVDGGPTYVYDAAGNLTGNGDRTIAYDAHNKAVQIAGPNGSVKFAYGADQRRVLQLATGNSSTRTVYVGLDAAGKSLYERTTTVNTGAVVHTVFIYAGGAHGGNAFAVRVLGNDGNTTSTRYMSFDHLGSTTAVSDEKGHIAAATGPDTQVLGYDAWGARRNPDGQPAAPSSAYPPSVGNRDFTGQETVPSVGLINMNGRVYDPVLARFLSPDPHLQSPGDLQNYNRYSYVLNNPLRYTDPTGYDFWDSVEAYFSNPMNDIELLQGIVACGFGGPIGCAAWGAQTAFINLMVAVGHGAPFEQTALMIGIGFGVNMLTSGLVGQLVGPAANPIWSIVAGTASAAITTALADVIAGKSVGWDVFWSGAIAAAQGAASLGLQYAQALANATPVKLSLNVKLVDPAGNPIPAADAARLIGEAEDAWTGLYGKYDVTANFHDPNGTDVTVTVYPSGGVSFTKGVGGNVVSLYAAGYQKPGGPLDPYSPQDLGEVFAHEIGHVLGAADQYDKTTQLAFPGHENDIMGSVTPGNGPFESTIVQILKFNGETP